MNPSNVLSELGHSPWGGAKVRMYRPGGQGDCFLLTLPAQGGRPQFVLVDCGVLHGTPGADQRLKAVAQNIAEVTGGILDVVVLSSRLMTHVSGFHFAKDVFKDLEIGQLLLPWKEDPADPEAVQLPKYISFLLTALKQVMALHSSFGSDAAALVREAEALPGSYPPTSGAQLEPLILEILDTAKARTKEVRYLSAGDLLEFTGVRFYILSPPYHTAKAGFLGMVSNSLGGMGIGEERAMDYTLQLLGLFSTWDQFSPEERALIWRSRPFDRADSIPLRDVHKSKVYRDFFRDHFGYKDKPDHGPAWRRIKADWEEPARYLMMHLAKMVQLSEMFQPLKPFFPYQAMAIELIESGKVLLFPADAKGNDWRFWHKWHWQQNNGPKVTFQDLLQRTVLYKVSHHGSAHGTPIDELALMTSPQLVAMLPVDQEQAKSKMWNMPEATLYQELLKQTHGRVLRLDREMPEKPADVSAEEWSQFASQVQFDPGGLWVEYTIDP